MQRIETGFGSVELYEDEASLHVKNKLGESFRSRVNDSADGMTLVLEDGEREIFDGSLDDLSDAGELFKVANGLKGDRQVIDCLSRLTANPHVETLLRYLNQS